MRVVWTNRAFDHLLQLHEQFRLTSEVYAERMVDRLISRSEQLEAFPYSGRRVPEYDRDDVRELIERPYRLVYRVREDRLDVLAVVHGRRLLPDEFDDLGGS